MDDTTVVLRLILTSGRVLSAADDITHGDNTEESLMQLYENLGRITYTSNVILDDFYSSGGGGSLRQQFTKTNPQGCLDALTEMEALIPRVDASGTVNGIRSTVVYFDQHRDLFQELLDLYVSSLIS